MSARGSPRSLARPRVLPLNDRLTRWAGDGDPIVALAESRRRLYATYQPVFWRPAPNAASRQRPYLARLFDDDEVITLVAVTETALTGFVIGSQGPAPPVYDPGGLTCTLDDFTVDRPDQWATVGKSLLRAAQHEARQRGAAQVVVVCGHLDQAEIVAQPVRTEELDSGSAPAASAMMPTMIELRLRPMTQAEFDAYQVQAAREYAAGHAKAGTWSPDEALVRSDEQFAQLLPDGRATADNLLLTARIPLARGSGSCGSACDIRAVPQILPGSSTSKSYPTAAGKALVARCSPRLRTKCAVMASGPSG